MSTNASAADEGTGDELTGLYDATLVDGGGLYPSSITHVYVCEPVPGRYEIVCVDADGDEVARETGTAAWIRDGLDDGRPGVTLPIDEQPTVMHDDPGAGVPGLTGLYAADVTPGAGGYPADVAHVYVSPAVEGYHEIVCVDAEGSVRARQDRPVHRVRAAIEDGGDGYSLGTRGDADGR